jgi:plastocyanin
MKMKLLIPEAPVSLMLILLGSAACLGACGGTPNTASQTAATVSATSAPVITTDAPTTTPPLKETYSTTIIISRSYANQFTLVHAGEKFTWINQDNQTHTVTANDGMFVVYATLQPGDAYEFLYSEPGTYRYQCTLHPGESAFLIIN